MKVLLAVTMTMLIGSSAFAACAVGTSNECTDKASCEGLSDSVKKFTFVANAPSGTPKCQSLDGPVTTNCTESKDNGRAITEAKGGVVKPAAGAGTDAPR